MSPSEGASEKKLLNMMIEKLYEFELFDGQDHRPPEKEGGPSPILTISFSEGLYGNHDRPP